MSTATAHALRPIVTTPGVYDLDDDTYHGDPVPEGSLSQSGAKLLLPPSCPAKYRWEVDNGRAPKACFDFGHAAHAMVLGTGPEIVRVEEGDWRTKAARLARDEAYATGQVPLLAEDHDTVIAMAKAIKDHPIAGRLFDPDTGKPEQSLFWQQHGIWRRARLDFLPDRVEGRRYDMVIPDYKTSISAAPEDFPKDATRWGHYMQAAWYIDAVTSLGLARNPAFVFVVQEKAPPYLVTVIALDEVALKIGRIRNKEACDIYAECKKSGRWPGYSDDVETVALPVWFEREFI